MKQIKDLMTTAPKSVRKDETIQAVSKQMSKSKIGFLPVVDENKKVIGTITDRDVALAIGQAGKTADKLKVQDVMNPKAHTILQEESTAKALEIMRTKKVGRLPVVDKERHLKGVVSLTSIAKRVKDTTDNTELVMEGKENIINTLCAISERDHSPEHISEFAEE